MASRTDLPNQISTNPDYLLGFDHGQPVAVPFSDPNGRNADFPSSVSGGGIATPFVVNNRDGLGRVTSYAENGITYTITYSVFGVSTISGNGKVRTIARDAAGFVTGVSDA